MAGDSHQHQPSSYYDASEGGQGFDGYGKKHQLFLIGQAEVTVT